MQKENVISLFFFPRQIRMCQTIGGQRTWVKIKML